jgi:iron complex outermembrane receptor protein
MRQASIPDVDLEAVGASARWRRQLGQRTELELGGRIDRVNTVADETIANTDLYFAYHSTRETSHSDTEPSASLRLTHQLGNELSLSAGITRSTRAADPRERYALASGADWVGNPS